PGEGVPEEAVGAGDSLRVAFSSQAARLRQLVFRGRLVLQVPALLASAQRLSPGIPARFSRGRRSRMPATRARRGTECRLADARARAVRAAAGPCRSWRRSGGAAR